MLEVRPRKASFHICYTARQKTSVAKTGPEHSDDLHVLQVHIFSHSLVAIQPDPIHKYDVLIVFIPQVQDAGLTTQFQKPDYGYQFAFKPFWGRYKLNEAYLGGLLLNCSIGRGDGENQSNGKYRREFIHF